MPSNHEITIVRVLRAKKTAVKVKIAWISF